MACSLGMNVAMMRTVRIAVVSEGEGIGRSSLVPGWQDAAVSVVLVTAGEKGVTVSHVGRHLRQAHLPQNNHIEVDVGEVGG